METEYATLITVMHYRYGVCSECYASLIKDDGTVKRCWKCKRRINKKVYMKMEDYMVFTRKIQTDRREMMIKVCQMKSR